ncbi:phenazine biosynthesis protein PhzA/PhzB [Nocardiopsis sp. CNR-923]|uniref:nuclear transport factor 2 family protein n=1 Tax=Nocardiopsis sp. CNR-923 TaxID=1904965 RepID=UPI00095B7808|nr:phenazine biosynthesis protein PhzA/PhzB [Nocardiopsis sp. CNR-923]OLT27550.1 phenazine biosynthesis protein PhzA/PhzB [Nocardiopsis sp. CNR-923]
MPARTSPELRIRHGLRLLPDRDGPACVGLWARDGVMERPFAPGSWPQRLLGRDSVAGCMRGSPDLIDPHDFPDVPVHRTAAPETTVVEMSAAGRLVSPYRMRYVPVVTVRDGRFAPCRDYWNPLALGRTGADAVRSAR